MNPYESRLRPPSSSRHALGRSAHGLPALLVAALLLSAGCSSRSAQPVTPDAPGETPSSSGSRGTPSAPPLGRTGDADEHLEERAVLLLLADRQSFEPLVVERSLTGPPSLRRDLAIALGRSGDPRGIGSLEGLLLDDTPAVRRRAAFALGELGEGSGITEADRERIRARLLEAVDDPDRETGQLAVEALGKLEASLEEVTRALGDLGDAESRARLLPDLYRFREPGLVPVAEAALEALDRDADRELYRWAVYALARDPQPEGLAALRRLLDAETARVGGSGAGSGEGADRQVQAWIARALGRLRDPAGAADLARLGALVGVGLGGELSGDGLAEEGAAMPRTWQEAGPVIQALGSARTLIARGDVAAPRSWRPRLLALLGAEHPGVRAAALDASSAWLLDDELSALLLEKVRDEATAPWERSAALAALATGNDPRAEELVREAALAGEPLVRRGAAEAAGVLGLEGVMAALLEDPDPRVRQAALAASLAWTDAAGQVMGTPGEELRQTLALEAGSALADPDPGVRSAALDWLGRHPLVPVDILGEILARALASQVLEERLLAVDALVARGQAEEGEREEAVAVLTSVGAEADFATRLRAVDGLAALGQPRPSPGAVATERTVAVYRQLLLRTREPVDAVVSTDRGAFTVRLACPETPLNCINFLQLAGQGFFDDLTFHRVVPDFVVQGGDPRGDGWGGPAYTLRDEIHPGTYERGTVGMALAGPHTGGSQFFVALSPQPHLDGGFTAFGEVVAGEEVLDRLTPGDRILEVVVPDGLRRR